MPQSKDTAPKDPVAWDPAQYLKFGGERLRPALDLMARIPSAAPGVVFDLGCGTGAMARLLAGRWPAASVTGVDGSSEMLGIAHAQVQAEGGIVAWVEADLAHWSPDGPVDLIYSNAALHWLDGHADLFPRLMGHLTSGGVLAVQMPRNHGAASHTCMTDAARAGPWRETLAPVLRTSPVAPPEVYYRLLAPLASSLDIWETVYTHVLEGDSPVVAWTRGTALRPLLDALDPDARDSFLADYTARIDAAYPKQADGKTLFSFRRLFIMAVK